MGKVLVKNAGSMLHTPHGVLEHGPNEIDSEKWDAMQKVPGVARRLENGELKTKAEKEDRGKVKAKEVAPDRTSFTK